MPFDFHLHTCLLDKRDSGLSLVRPDTFQVHTFHIHHACQFFLWYPNYTCHIIMHHVQIFLLVGIEHTWLNLCLLRNVSIRADNSRNRWARFFCHRTFLGNIECTHQHHPQYLCTYPLHSLCILRKRGEHTVRMGSPGTQKQWRLPQRCWLYRVDTARTRTTNLLRKLMNKYQVHNQGKHLASSHQQHCWWCTSLACTRYRQLQRSVTDKIQERRVCSLCRQPAPMCPACNQDKCNRP